jgi:hypothetical protein|tara:strand:+ start:2606 stop:2974 length:369 start_codon:yes stop_codon:yes gene_type:complete
MSVRYEDFTINQGSDVAIEIHCEDENGAKKDLTNYSVNALMKRNYRDSDGDPFSKAFNGIIATPPSDGVVSISLTNTETDSLLTRGRYVFDVELSFVDSDSNTIVERILEGQIEVSPSVSKP